MYFIQDNVTSANYPYIKPLQSCLCTNPPERKGFRWEINLGPEDARFEFLVVVIYAKARQASGL